MHTPALACPPQEVLLERLAGGLSEHESAMLEEHLDGCPACLGRLALLAQRKVAGASQEGGEGRGRGLTRGASRLARVVCDPRRDRGLLLISGGSDEARAALVELVCARLQARAGGRSLWSRWFGAAESVTARPVRLPPGRLTDRDLLPEEGRVALIVDWLDGAQPAPALPAELPAGVFLLAAVHGRSPYLGWLKGQACAHVDLDAS
jgi:hypothetical protein